jgi:hypothetical protein
MRHTQKYFEKNGIKLYPTKGEKLAFRLDCTTKDIFNMYADACKDVGAVFDGDKNAKHAREKLGDGRGAWYGWTKRQMLAAGKGNFDMAPFLAQREKLSKLRASLQEEVKPVGRMRKRCLSEHDGEWQMERQWEIAPFTATRRETGGYLPTLAIDIDFSFSVGVDSDKIAEFGAFCWAIVDVLESTGITTDLAVQNTGYLEAYNDMGDLAGTNKGLLTNVAVKTAGEYVDTMTLARCFTPGFLRRGIFLAKYAAGDALGASLGSGLSMPFIQERPVVSPGRLFLRRQDMTSNPETVAAWILQALKGSKNESAAS